MNTRRFLALGRYTFVFVLLTASAYIANLGGLFYKGTALEYLLQSDNKPKVAITLVLIFCFLHLVSSLIKTLSIHWRQWMRSHYFEKSWRDHLPDHLKSSAAEHPEKFFQNIAVNIPNFEDGRFVLANSYTAAAIIFCVYIAKTVHDQLWLGLMLLPLLAGFSWLAGIAFRQKMKEALNENMNQQNRLMRWCRDYFLSYRERQLNWEGQNSKLSDSFAFGYLHSCRRRGAIQFAKSLTIFSCVDVPFVLSMGAVMGAAAYGKIGIADLVIWIGIIEYLVEANNLIIQAREQSLQRKILGERIAKDLEGIKQGVRETPTHEIKDKSTLSLQLLDLSEIELKTCPGIYHIRGKNGSGKSTLLNAILGLEDHYDSWDKIQVQSFAATIRNHCRVIERNTVLFANVDDFAAQIIGTLGVTWADLRLHIVATLSRLVAPDITAEWMQEIDQIEKSWVNRDQKSLSTGELVVLSFLRAISFWKDSVKVLIVDEAEGGLDQNRQRLFRKTMVALAERIAIYYVAHTPRPLRSASSVAGSAFTLGYSKAQERAIPIELRIIGSYPGNGARKAYGSIGTAIAADVDLVVASLIHTNGRLSYLKNLDLYIECDCEGKLVRDSRSARLAIAVALLNVHRGYQGMEPISGVAATGYVRLDGGVDPVDHVAQKAKAAQEVYIKKIITPKETQNLSQLLNIMGVALA